MRAAGITGFLVLFLALEALAGSLGGRVTRADSGAAVPGARVLIRGTEYLAVAGADGRYEFSSVPDDAYGLSCSADGLRGAASGAVSIGAGTIRDFSLEPPADGTSTLRGAASCAGSPCAGVIVIARQGTSVRARGLSGPDGSYQLVDLPPGEYEISGLRYGCLPASAALTIPDDGSVHDLVQNLELAAGGSYSITGVVGLSDNPLDRGGSTVRCNGQSPPLAATTSAGGSYWLRGVSAGPLAFTAQAAGYRPHTRIDEIVAGDKTINFVLHRDENGQGDPGYTLSGTVVLQVLDGGDIFSPAGSRVSVWAVDGDCHRADVTGADGSYRIGALPPGRYRAGAAREGFSTQLTDAFDLFGDRTLDFSLQQDTLYDWGPGEQGSGAGCGCGRVPCGGTALLMLLPMLRRRTWPKRRR